LLSGHRQHAFPKSPLPPQVRATPRFLKTPAGISTLTIHEALATREKHGPCPHCHQPSAPTKPAQPAKPPISNTARKFGQEIRASTLNHHFWA
jgi:hypothetical protein